MTKKLIYGSLQLCQIVSTLTIEGEAIEVGKYLYKDKDPVYFVFNVGEVKPRLIAMELNLVPELVRVQIKNRGVISENPKPLKPKKRVIKERSKSLNFIQLKIYRIL